MKHLVNFNEGSRNFPTSVELSKEDKKDVLEILNTLTDIGFRINSQRKPDQIGTMFRLSKRIDIDSTKIDHNQPHLRTGETKRPISYVVGSNTKGGHPINVGTGSVIGQPLDLKKLIGELEEYELVNGNFKLISTEITDGYLEILDRIDDSRFNLIYFEVRIQIDYDKIPRYDVVLKDQAGNKKLPYAMYIFLALTK